MYNIQGRIHGGVRPHEFHSAPFKNTGQHKSLTTNL